MKVLVINSLSAHYGSTVRARLIYRALNDIGVKASYVESNSDLKSPGVISISQRNNIFSYFMASLQRAWLCWRGDYEVCIIQKITPLTIFAIFSVMLRQKRLIVDWDDLDSQFQANNFRKLLVSFIEKKLPRYLQQITVHNKYLADYAANLGAQNITIIPQCIDTETFDPHKYDVDMLKASKGLAGKIVLTYLCTFTEGGTCDLDIVLEAVAEARKENPSLYLLLVGGGPLEYKYRRRLRELAISEGAITGFLSGRQVAEYLAISDICLVYMRDNLGNRMRMSLKTLEYLAMVKKVIGHVVGETKDVLSRYITLSGESYISLSKNIGRIVAEKNYVGSMEARDYIIANYSYEVMKQAVRLVLESGGK